MLCRGQPSAAERLANGSSRNGGTANDKEELSPAHIAVRQGSRMIDYRSNLKLLAAFSLGVVLAAAALRPSQRDFEPANMAVRSAPPGPAAAATVAAAPAQLAPQHRDIPDRAPDIATSGLAPATDHPPAARNGETEIAPGDPAGTVAPQIAVESDVTATPRTVDACNYEACADAYRSFRADDCTYQPYGGPRRRCDKDAVTADSTVGAPAPATPVPCNIAVCERYYRSFDPSDCTYRPYGGGPRRLCDR
jgi:hypothetical protein